MVDVCGIRPFGCGAQPQFPVQRRGDVRLRWSPGARVILLPLHADPGVNFLDLADYAFLQQPRSQPVFKVGVNLVSHLRDELFLFGEQPHLTRFPDRVRQRLLAITVFAAIHGEHRGRSVHVIGGRHDDGIELVAQLLDHLAVIGEVGDARKMLVDLIKPVRIDIAESDELHLGMRTDIRQIRPTHPVCPDRRDVELGFLRLL